MSDLNSFLYREILDGRAFDALIPDAPCKSTALGMGDTDHSIDMMVDWIELHSGQMEKVAARLKKSSLSATAFAVYDFCYDHFQYKADESDQLLRSPACAWKQRYDGIDCKTYSIVASSILREMGLGHYIRKIKQPTFEPTEYTHVYVILPQDQVTFDLSKGYHVIDGTTHDNQEPPFLQAKDEFMSELKHIGLNAPADPNGLNGFSLSDIGGTIGGWFNLKCPGAAALDEPQYQANLKSIQKWYDLLIAEMNQAIQNNNATLLAEAFDEFDVYTKVFVESARQEAEKTWKNKCTKERLQGQHKAFTFYDTTVRNALNSWVSKYFSVTAGSQQLRVNHEQAMASLGWAKWLIPAALVERIKTTSVFSLRSGVTDIVAFELTPYVVDKANSPSSFNAGEFLTGLATVIQTFQPSGGGAAIPDGSLYDPTTGTPLNNGNLDKPSLGGGTLLAIAGLTIVGATIFAKSKNQPQKSKS